MNKCSNLIGNRVGSFTVIFISIFFVSNLTVHTAKAATVINARILPTVWYSSLSVSDGDSVKIYVAVQNNSGINFSGTASFVVDDKKIHDEPFTSQSGILTGISSDWTAVPGNHSVQVSIVPNISSSVVLVSVLTDKSSINIVRNISPAAIQGAVYNTATNIVNQTNIAANNLASKVEALKDPNTPQSLFGDGSVSSGNAVRTGTLAKKPGSVLGTSTKAISVLGSGTVSSKSNVSGDISPMTFIYNTFIDLLAFLIRNWIWTIGSIIVLYLLYKIVGKFRKD